MLEMLCTELLRQQPGRGWAIFLLSCWVPTYILFLNNFCALKLTKPLTQLVVSTSRTSSYFGGRQGEANRLLFIPFLPLPTSTEKKKKSCPTHQLVKSLAIKDN